MREPLTTKTQPQSSRSGDSCNYLSNETALLVTPEKFLDSKYLTTTQSLKDSSFLDSNGNGTNKVKFNQKVSVLQYSPDQTANTDDSFSEPIDDVSKTKLSSFSIPSENVSAESIMDRVQSLSFRLNRLDSSVNANFSNSSRSGFGSKVINRTQQEVNTENSSGQKNYFGSSIHEHVIDDDDIWPHQNVPTITASSKVGHGLKYYYNNNNFSANNRSQTADDFNDSHPVITDVYSSHLPDRNFSSGKVDNIHARDDCEDGYSFCNDEDDKEMLQSNTGGSTFEQNTNEKNLPAITTFANETTFKALSDSISSKVIVADSAIQNLVDSKQTTCQNLSKMSSEENKNRKYKPSNNISCSKNVTSNNSPNETCGNMNQESSLKNRNSVPGTSVSMCPLSQPVANTTVMKISSELNKLKTENFDDVIKKQFLADPKLRAIINKNALQKLNVSEPSVYANLPSIEFDEEELSRRVAQERLSKVKRENPTKLKENVANIPELMDFYDRKFFVEEPFSQSVYDPPSRSAPSPGKVQSSSGQHAYRPRLKTVRKDEVYDLYYHKRMWDGLE